SEIVAEYQAGEPAVWSLMGKLITDFVIHADGAKFPGEFDRHKETLAGRCDAAPDRVVGIVQEGLGENRDVEAGFPGIVETPLDAEIRLTETKLGPGSRILHAQPGIFVSELNAIANSEIDVEIGRVGDGLIAVEKGHVAEIDFPIEMARSARIVGVIRWAALGKCRG